MVKVRVLGLRGCSRCEALIKELDDGNVPYTLLDANEHTFLADKVEEFLEIEEYPIVILESTSTSYYIFRGQTSKHLSEVVSGKIIKKGCTTSTDMANYIKKLIHY